MRSFLVILDYKSDQSPNRDGINEMFNRRHMFFVSIFDDVEMVDRIELRPSAHNVNQCVINYGICHPALWCQPTNHIIDLTTGCDLGSVEGIVVVVWVAFTEDFCTEFVAWVYELH